jgi:nucleotide-binding universal stress UspA family protein
MYNYILVPLDGSKRAEAILPHVEGMARQSDAEVILLRVIESVPLCIGPEDTPVVVDHKALRRQTDQALSYLGTLQEEYRGKDIEARVSVYYGSVVQAIIGAAECECADLIAMASHGRGGASQVFNGSVAAGVLHRLNRPLLLVRTGNNE